MALPVNSNGLPATSMEKIQYLQYLALKRLVTPARTALHEQKGMDLREADVVIGCHSFLNPNTTNYGMTDIDRSLESISDSIATIDTLRANMDNISFAAFISLIHNRPNISIAEALALLSMQWDNDPSFTEPLISSAPVTTTIYAL